MVTAEGSGTMEILDSTAGPLKPMPPVYLGAKWHVQLTLSAMTTRTSPLLQRQDR